MKVCLGGTFNILHKGHHAIILEAFKVAGEKGMVYIGLTSDNYSKFKKKRLPYVIRKQNLEEYLNRKGYLNRTKIVPISNKFGLTLEYDFDAIVVSPETKKIALQINKKRSDRNLKPLRIFQIEYVLAGDNKPISSTRIINKEIDDEGRILPDN
jgi:pantetheine-phosphate adenylyltransferase